MASWLEPIIPSPESLTRLQSAVATPPQRYAPFYDRVAELFDLPKEAVVAELARLAAPNAWRFAGLPGVRNVAVQAGPRTAGAETVFARFDPGTRFPRHRHTGVETVLVLEGEYEDSQGIMHSGYPGLCITFNRIYVLLKHRYMLRQGIRDGSYRVTLLDNTSL